MAHGAPARFASRFSVSGNAQRYARQHRSSESHLAHLRITHRKSHTHTLRIVVRLVSRIDALRMMRGAWRMLHRASHILAFRIVRQRVW
jgi:hypothetical protein